MRQSLPLLLAVSAILGAAPTVKADQTLYWATSRSIFNDMGEASFTDGVVYNYKVEAEYSGSDVTIADIFNIKSPFLSETYPLRGRLSDDRKSITVPCLGYDIDYDIEAYTWVAQFQDSQGPFYGVLMAGNVGYDGAINLIDELTFDILDDGSLSPRTAFGIYCVDPLTGEDMNFYDYYLSCQLSRMTNEPRLFVSDAKIEFSDHYVAQGFPSTVTIEVANLCLDELECTATVSSDQLSVNPASRTLQPGVPKSVQITLTPQSTGLFQGEVTFEAGGAIATVVVTADVHDSPDYSAIVKEGDFSFTLDQKYPFVVVDELAGIAGPLAVSSNIDTGTSSSLTADFTVPEGKVGILEYGLWAQTRQPNAVKVECDDDILINYMYGDQDDPVDLSQSLPLGAGEHTLTFTNTTTIDWYSVGYSEAPARCLLTSLSLRLFDADGQGAVATTESLDFGDLYFDLLPVSKSMTFDIINVGAEPLTITGASGSDNFSVEYPEQAAAQLESLQVTVTFTATALGQFEDEVAIHTSAGDVKVRCLGGGVKLPYDYTQIVKAGQFSFNTSVQYPFIALNGKAWNSTATLDAQGSQSWLEATFVVPEGETGYLQWEAYNSSADFFTFMDNTVFCDGTVVTLDGESWEFAGEEYCSSWSVAGTEQIEMAPGTHTLRWEYFKVFSEYEGNDRCTIESLSLTLSGAGVADAVSQKAIDHIEYYELTGRQIASPSGLVIRRTVYIDGASTSEKAVIHE